MVNIIKSLFISLLFIILNLNFTYGYENSDIIESIDNIEINNSLNLNIEKNLKVDLTEELKELRNLYNETNIQINWEIKDINNTIKSDIFDRKFESIGNKKIDIIFLINGKEYTRKNINVFVYKNSSILIYDNTLDKLIVDNYIQTAKDSGFLLNLIGPIDISTLHNLNLSLKINTIKKSTDYLVIWGEKDFIFDIVSKLNRENIRTNFKEAYNILVLTSFNIDILGSYAKNFLTNNNWINKFIITGEDSKLGIFKNNKINDFTNELDKNEYNYLDVDIHNLEINNIYFISNFINNLSSKGFDTENIYLVIIIPILFFFISFFKHFIGLTPTGTIIPVILSIIVFKMGLLITITLFTFYIIFNILLGKLTNRYTLLYTPKISFIITLNIIFFIIFINLIIKYNLLPINFTDSLYFILFIIVTERLLTIILSKEFMEYKETLFITILISLFSYYILSISSVKIFLLSYPEFIVIMVPLTFLMGKFTGLRITEYFRFKEVIRNIEE